MEEHTPFCVQHLAGLVVGTPNGSFQWLFVSPKGYPSRFWTHLLGRYCSLEVMHAFLEEQYANFPTKKVYKEKKLESANSLAWALELPGPFSMSDFLLGHCLGIL